MTPKERELHTQLIAAFEEYIRHNLIWEEKGFDIEAKRTRAALRKILDVAYLRWQEVQKSRNGNEDHEVKPNPTMMKDLNNNLMYRKGLLPRGKKGGKLTDKYSERREELRKGKNKGTDSDSTTDE